MIGAEVRRLSSWIDGYLEHTSIVPSTPIFRRWAAISLVAAAMERKVWIRTMGSDLYPNLYTILVGPPGIGKGEALKVGEDLMREVPDLCIGPSDMTSASLVDSLNESVRRIVMRGNPPYIEFNSLYVISRELGVLLPQWDAAILNNLTDIYDGRVLEQKRRGRDLKIKILHPQVNLLGATTPSYLNQLMPTGAWDQGFISRTLLIYSGERTPRDPFFESEGGQKALYNDLLHDLKIISTEYGKLNFTTEAAEAIRTWVKLGCPPEPTHARLQHYNSRRLAHFLKLCMVSSISRSGAKVISLDHYSEAMNWLIEAEVHMNDIFKALTSGGDSSVMEDTWHFVWSIYAKEKKPLMEHRIVHFIKERVPAHSVMRILDVMVKSQMFEIELGANGMAGYKPSSRPQRSN